MLLNTEKLDPREQRTRQLLQAALEELLSTQPFNKVSVRDITASAGINRATFYDHFTDKYALLNYVVQARFQVALDQHLTVNSAFSVDNLELLIHVTCEFLGQFVDHCSPAEHEGGAMMLETPVQQYLQAVLLDWLQSSSSDIAPEIVASVMSWSIMGIARQWAYGNRDLTAGAMAEQTLPLIVAGVQPYLND